MHDVQSNIKTISPLATKLKCRRESVAVTKPSESEIRNSLASAESWISEHGLPIAIGGAPW
ncbi:MAG: hypothetical protein JWP89_2676 [Schlesneria sp.]|nr:hypothetical protein [Schlesneria sp.]